MRGHRCAAGLAVRRRMSVSAVRRQCRSAHLALTACHSCTRYKTTCAMWQIRSEGQTVCYRHLRGSRSRPRMPCAGPDGQHGSQHCSASMQRVCNNQRLKATGLDSSSACRCGAVPRSGPVSGKRWAAAACHRWQPAKAQGVVAIVPRGCNWAGATAAGHKIHLLAVPAHAALDA